MFAAQKLKDCINSFVQITAFHNFMSYRKSLGNGKFLNEYKFKPFKQCCRTYKIEIEHFFSLSRNNIVCLLCFNSLKLILDGKLF